MSDAAPRPLRALLVEDSPDDAALVVRQLRRGGFEPETRRVETADEMDAALAEPWDVVLSDFSMPSFTGLDAHRVLRSHDPDTPFILISGTVGEDVAVAAMKAGIQDYLMKDKLERLVPAIERELVDAEARRAGRRAAEALRDSEERYRTLIETSPDAILLLDEDLNVRIANARAAVLLGRSLSGQRLTEVVPEDRRDAVATRLSAVAPGGPPEVLELVLLLPGARRFAAELAVSRADARRARGLVVVIRDVTERRRGEVLREAQLRVTRILADPLSLEDTSRRLVSALADVFGWDVGALHLVDRDENELRLVSAHTLPGEASGIWLRQSFGPGEGLPGRVWASGSPVFVPKLRAASGSLRLDRAAGAGMAQAIAFPVLAGAEVIGVFEFFAREMEEPGEELLATLGQVGSQTGAFVARTRAEDAFHESEARIRAIAEELDRQQRFLLALLDTLVEGIVACDHEGRITLFNRAMREFLGIGAEPIVPEELSKGSAFYRPDGTTPLSAGDVPLTRAFRGERVSEQEMVIKPRDGVPRTVVASGRPIIDSEGQKLGAVVAMHDVTARKRLEEQFRQSQKMEALGSLAGGVAHDFNNLLTTILGYTELLMMRYEDPALREDLAEVKKAGERAASLTQKLLAFSRKQIVEARVLDLNAVITDLESILRRLLGPDIRLLSRLRAEIGRVKADPGQIEQLLLNLVVNARDAMPEGGDIVIETGAEIVTEAVAREHVGSRPGPHVFLVVEDQGTGIPPDVLPRIFEPFFTTKEEGKGTGLGLSTVFGIAAQGGGHVRVSSERGRGTRFAVYLPRVEEAASRRSSHVLAAVPSGSETILLVDDQEAVRGLARRVLEATGYAVLEAENAQEALALAERHRRIDLLLTDTVMPGLSGPKLALRLKAARPDLKVLFMSGYADTESVAAGEMEGAAFLPKPFTPLELAQRVRRALDDGTEE